MKLRLFLLAALASSLVTSSQATVSLPHIFSDHMVLQQGTDLPIWGTASPGEKVTASIVGQQAATTADAQGHWLLKLPPLPATATPLTLEVSGENHLVIHDILIGEVWICSGQSNMVLSQRNLISPEVGAKGQIRFYKLPNISSLTPQPDAPGQWIVCTPKEADPLFFSAVGYYFAVAIQKDRGVPVGMIESAWSGTAIEPWIDLSTFAQSEPYQKTAAKLKSDQARAPQQVAEKTGKSAGQYSRTPTGIFNGMINPLIPYAIKGVLWYQGESNTQNAKRSAEYATLLPMLISSWRGLWHQGEFPFLYVQLPAFTTDRAWVLLRDSQAKALSLPRTGMAVTLDLNPTDNLHPPHKEAVGERLALLARKIAYGENLVASGPLYQSSKIEGNKIRLTFTDIGSGLTLGTPPPLYRRTKVDAPAEKNLLGFKIAGADGAFVPANAEIDGSSIIVWSDKITQPASVSYAWDNYPHANLYNKEGLPAAPFTTASSAPH